jgi:hypothetical protein
MLRENVRSRLLARISAHSIAIGVRDIMQPPMAT